MILGQRFKYKNRNYILSGFGKITMKSYLIKKNTIGEFITFNMKRVYLTKNRGKGSK